MDLNARITLAIKNFFKKYGKIILIGFAIWLIIFIINQNLKKLPNEIQINTSYEPYTPVIDSGGNVPEKYQEKINTTIDNYFNYCNNKKYENAYNMLTEDCRNYLYGDLSLFKEYVDNIFNTNKTYNIQNYSNVDGVYIYDINIIDDIESTGTTGKYEPYKEKIALRIENKEFKISNQGFIESKDYNIISEDDYIRVTVKSKDVSYRKEGYNLTIQNKTDKYIDIIDNSINAEVTLNLGDQKRTVTNYSNAMLVLNPNATTDVVFIFDKFYDDKKNPKQISLETIRILDNYTIGLENTSEQAERMYSYNINLTK